MGDDRDREIAELKAEVERLREALDGADDGADDAADGPLFGHGVHGGYFGVLEIAIAAIALTILLSVAHRLTTPDPWRSHPEVDRWYVEPDGRIAP